MGGGQGSRRGRGGGRHANGHGGRGSKAAREGQAQGQASHSNVKQPAAATPQPAAAAPQEHYLSSVATAAQQQQQQQMQPQYQTPPAQPVDVAAARRSASSVASREDARLTPVSRGSSGHLRMESPVDAVPTLRPLTVEVHDKVAALERTARIAAQDIHVFREGAAQWISSPGKVPTIEAYLTLKVQKMAALLQATHTSCSNAREWLATAVVATADAHDADGAAPTTTTARLGELTVARTVLDEAVARVREGMCRDIASVADLADAADASAEARAFLENASVQLYETIGAEAPVKKTVLEEAPTTTETTTTEEPVEVPQATTPARSSCATTTSSAAVTPASDAAHADGTPAATSAAGTPVAAAAATPEATSENSLVKARVSALRKSAASIADEAKVMCEGAAEWQDMDDAAFRGVADYLQVKTAKIHQLVRRVHLEARAAHECYIIVAGDADAAADDATAEVLRTALTSAYQTVADSMSAMRELGTSNDVQARLNQIMGPASDLGREYVQLARFTTSCFDADATAGAESPDVTTTTEEEAASPKEAEVNEEGAATTEVAVAETTTTDAETDAASHWDARLRRIQGMFGAWMLVVDAIRGSASRCTHLAQEVSHYLDVQFLKLEGMVVGMQEELSAAIKDARASEDATSAKARFLATAALIMARMDTELENVKKVGLSTAAAEYLDRAVATVAGEIKAARGEMAGYLPEVSVGSLKESFDAQVEALNTQIAHVVEDLRALPQSVQATRRAVEDELHSALAPKLVAVRENAAFLCYLAKAKYETTVDPASREALSAAVAAVAGQLDDLQALAGRSREQAKALPADVIDALAAVRTRLVQTVARVMPTAGEETPVYIPSAELCGAALNARMADLRAVLYQRVQSIHAQLRALLDEASVIRDRSVGEINAALAPRVAALSDALAALNEWVRTTSATADVANATAVRARFQHAVSAGKELLDCEIAKLVELATVSAPAPSEYLRTTVHGLVDRIATLNEFCPTTQDLALAVEARLDAIPEWMAGIKATLASADVEGVRAGVEPAVQRVVDAVAALSDWAQHRITDLRTDGVLSPRARARYAALVLSVHAALEEEVKKLREAMPDVDAVAATQREAFTDVVRRIAAGVDEYGRALPARAFDATPGMAGLSVAFQTKLHALQTQLDHITAEARQRGGEYSHEAQVAVAARVEQLRGTLQALLAWGSESYAVYHDELTRTTVAQALQHASYVAHCGLDRVKGNVHIPSDMLGSVTAAAAGLSEWCYRHTTVAPSIASALETFPALDAKFHEKVVAVRSQVAAMVEAATAARDARTVAVREVLDTRLRDLRDALAALQTWVTLQYVSHLSEATRNNVEDAVQRVQYAYTEALDKLHDANVADVAGDVAAALQEKLAEVYAYADAAHLPAPSALLLQNAAAAFTSRADVITQQLAAIRSVAADLVAQGASGNVHDVVGPMFAEVHARFAALRSWTRGQYELHVHEDMRWELEEAVEAWVDVVGKEVTMLRDTAASMQTTGVEYFASATHAVQTAGQSLRDLAYGEATWQNLADSFGADPRVVATTAAVSTQVAKAQARAEALKRAILDAKTRNVEALSTAIEPHVAALLAALKDLQQWGEATGYPAEARKYTHLAVDTVKTALEEVQHTASGVADDVSTRLDGAKHAAAAVALSTKDASQRRAQYIYEQLQALAQEGMVVKDRAAVLLAPRVQRVQEALAMLKARAHDSEAAAAIERAVALILSMDVVVRARAVSDEAAARVQPVLAELTVQALALRQYAAEQRARAAETLPALLEALPGQITALVDEAKTLRALPREEAVALLRVRAAEVRETLAAIAARTRTTVHASAAGGAEAVTRAAAALPYADVVQAYLAADAAALKERTAAAVATAQDAAGLLQKEYLAYTQWGVDRCKAALAEAPLALPTTETFASIENSMASLRVVLSEVAAAVHDKSATAVDAVRARVEPLVAQLQERAGELNAAVVRAYASAVDPQARAELTSLLATRARGIADDFARLQAHIPAPLVSALAAARDQIAVLTLPAGSAKEVFDTHAAAIAKQLAGLQANVKDMASANADAALAAMQPRLAELNDTLAAVNAWAAVKYNQYIDEKSRAKLESYTLPLREVIEEEIAKVQAEVEKAGVTGAARAYLDAAVEKLSAQAVALSPFDWSALESRVDAIRQQFKALVEAVNAAKDLSAEDVREALQPRVAQVQASLVSLNTWALATYKSRIDAQSRSKLEACVIPVRAAIDGELTKIQERIAECGVASGAQQYLEGSVATLKEHAVAPAIEMTRAAVAARFDTLRAEVVALTILLGTTQAHTTQEFIARLEPRVTQLRDTAAALNAWAATKYAGLDEQARVAFDAYITPAREVVEADLAQLRAAAEASGAAVAAKEYLDLWVIRVQAQVSALASLAMSKDGVKAALDARRIVITAQLKQVLDTLRMQSDATAEELRVLAAPTIAAVRESAAALNSWAVAKYEAAVDGPTRDALAKHAATVHEALNAELAKVRATYTEHGVRSTLEQVVADVKAHAAGLSDLRVSPAAVKAVVDARVEAVVAQVAPLVASAKDASVEQLAPKVAAAKAALANFTAWAEHVYTTAVDDTSRARIEAALAPARAFVDHEVMKVTARAGAVGVPAATREYILDATRAMLAQTRALALQMRRALADGLHTPVLRGASAAALAEAAAARAASITAQVRALAADAAAHAVVEAKVAQLQDAIAALKAWAAARYESLPAGPVRRQLEEVLVAARTTIEAELARVNETPVVGAAREYLETATAALKTQAAAIVPQASLESVQHAAEALAERARERLAALQAAAATAPQDAQAALAPYTAQAREAVAALSEFAATVYATRTPEEARKVVEAAVLPVKAHVEAAIQKVRDADAVPAVKAYLTEVLDTLSAKTAALHVPALAPEQIVEEFKTRSAAAQAQVADIAAACKAGSEARVAAQVAVARSQAAALQAWAEAVYTARVPEDVRAAVEEAAAEAVQSILAEAERLRAVSADAGATAAVKTAAEDGVIVVKAAAARLPVAQAQATAILSDAAAVILARLAQLREAVAAGDVPSVLDAAHAAEKAMLTFVAFLDEQYYARISQDRRAEFEAFVKSTSAQINAKVDDVRAAATTDNVKAAVASLQATAATIVPTVRDELETKGRAIAQEITSITASLKDLTVADARAALEQRLAAAAAAMNALQEHVAQQCRDAVSPDAREAMAARVIAARARIQGAISELHERVEAAEATRTARHFIDESLVLLRAQAAALSAYTPTTARAVALRAAVDGYAGTVAHQLDALYAAVAAAVTDAKNGAALTDIVGPRVAHLQHTLAALSGWAVVHYEACVDESSRATVASYMNPVAARVTQEVEVFRTKVAELGASAAVKEYVCDSVQVAAAQARASYALVGSNDAVLATLQAYAASIRAQLAAIATTIAATKTATIQEIKAAVGPRVVELRAALDGFQEWAVAKCNHVDTNTRAQLEKYVNPVKQSMLSELEQVREAIVASGYTGAAKVYLDTALGALARRAKQLTVVVADATGEAKAALENMTPDELVEACKVRVALIQSQLTTLTGEVAALSAASAACDEAREVLAPRFQQLQATLHEVTEWGKARYVQYVDEQSREKLEAAAKTIREIVETEVEKIHHATSASGSVNAYVGEKSAWMTQQARSLTSFVFEERVAWLNSQFALIKQDVVELKDLVTTGDVAGITTHRRVGELRHALEPKVQQILRRCAAVQERAGRLLAEYSDSEYAHRVEGILSSVHDTLVSTSAQIVTLATSHEASQAVVDVADALKARALQFPPIANLAPKVAEVATRVQDQLTTSFNDCPDTLKTNLSEMKSVAVGGDQALHVKAWMLTMLMLQSFFIVVSLVYAQAAKTGAAAETPMAHPVARRGSSVSGDADTTSPSPRNAAAVRGDRNSVSAEVTTEDADDKDDLLDASD